MIGDKILSCRKKAGLSQEALAQELGISRQAVSRWETGEAVPDTEKIIQLSRLFEVTTDYLLLDEVEEPQTEAPAEKMQTDALKEKRRGLRVFFEKLLLFLGLLGLIATLIGAVAYASIITEWYTEWGPFGTVLFRTWMLAPLIISVCVLLAGIVLLWREYLRED